jgi:hypothetical protein
MILFPGLDGEPTLRLNRIEKWLVVFLVAILVWDAFAFVWFGIATLICILFGVTVVGLPIGLILFCGPGVALYLFAALPFYLVLRRFGRLLAAMVALGTVLVVGAAVAVSLNAELSRKLADVTRGDIAGDRVSIKPGQTVAYLDTANVFAKGRCLEECQRLLYGGRAKAVIIGEPGALHGRGSLQKFWLERRTGTCPGDPAPYVPAADADVGKDAPYPRPPLSQALGYPNDCLREGAGRLSEADIVLLGEYLTGWRPPPGQRVLIDLQPPHIDLRKTAAIYQKIGGRWHQTMRHSYAEGYAFVIPPLIVIPMELDSYDAGGWLRARWPVRVGKEPSFRLETFIVDL